MSFLDRLLGHEPETENAHGIAKKAPELVRIEPGQISELESSCSREITVPAWERASAAASSLVPLAANAAQAASTYGMAVVKFPEGVSWADLCVRKSDGWNLLSNFKDGKFNDMAAIKQAGLQPAAIANLALQGAAIAVGQAYMTQINNKLEGIESGIEEIQRSMERERDANLKAAYDSLRRLALKYEEFAANEEKRISAQGIIEDALKEASRAIHYEAAEMCDLSAQIERTRQLNKSEIEKEVAKLERTEQRAGAAFQLYSIAQQASMRLDNDYTTLRIENDQTLINELADEYLVSQSCTLDALHNKVNGLKGAPLIPADRIATDYEPANPALDAVHHIVASASRIKPTRMRAAAEESLAKSKALLHDQISEENTVRSIVARHASQLDELEFAFNHANTLVFDGTAVRLLSIPENDTSHNEHAY